MTNTLDQMQHERLERDYEAAKAVAGEKASEWPDTYDEAVTGFTSQIEAGTKKKAEQIAETHRAIRKMHADGKDIPEIALKFQMGFDEVRNCLKSK